MMTGLELFAFGGNDGGISISASLAAAGGISTVSFTVQGDAGAIVLPGRPAASAPSRRDGLWEHTCFEFFTGASEGGPYREINVAPGGDWNIYEFDSYRKGMREDAFAGAPVVREFVAGKSKISFVFETTVRPGTLINLCAVTGHRDGSKRYWAARHGATRPDFHSNWISLSPDFSPQS